MPVLKTTVETKNRIFVYRTKCFYYNPALSKRSRGIRIKGTGEGKRERNRRAAYLKRKHEFYENFNMGDYWITLTYKNWVEPKEADKILSGVLSKMQKRLKRKNIPFVWYKTTEAGDTMRAHHHLLIRNTSPEIVSMIVAYWQEYGKIKDITEINNMENGKLVQYFLDGGNHKNLNYKTFGHSRNLRQPKIKKRIYPHDSFRENPRVPKPRDGYRYEIVPGSLYNGFPDLDGFTYQEYELRRVAIRE